MPESIGWRRAGAAAAVSASATRLACWRSRWRRMSCSPSSTRPRLPARGSVGGFQPLQQIGHALFEMGEGRGVVVADRDAVEPFGQRAQRAFEMFRIVARRPAARGVSSVEVSAAMRCSSMAKESLLPSERDKLVDLGRQRVHVVGQAAPARRWRRRWRRCARSAAIAPSSCCTVEGSSLRAQDQVELGAEIADRLVVAGELLGRRQRAQRFADFAERALDAGQRLAVAAVLAGFVDAAGQRADFVLDRFDRPARHRLGDGVADFGEFAAEAAIDCST